MEEEGGVDEGVVVHVEGVVDEVLGVFDGAFGEAFPLFVGEDIKIELGAFFFLTGAMNFILVVFVGEFKLDKDFV